MVEVFTFRVGPISVATLVNRFVNEVKCLRLDSVFVLLQQRCCLPKCSLLYMYAVNCLVKTRLEVANFASTLLIAQRAKQPVIV